MVALSFLPPAERCRSGRTGQVANLLCGVNLHRGFESPPLRQFFRAPQSLQAPFVERYRETVKKRSAVSELLDMLAKGLAKVSPKSASV